MITASSPVGVLKATLIQKFKLEADFLDGFGEGIWFLAHCSDCMSVNFSQFYFVGFFSQFLL